MHKIIMFAAVAALAGCSQQKTAAPANDANMAATNDANMATANDANMASAETPAATPAASSLDETTWTYTEKGKKIQESIDADGNYVATSGSEHIDHGKYASVGGKACFTSAMDKKGPRCWTVKDTAVGETMATTSDKGEKLMVTRIAYVAAPPMK